MIDFGALLKVLPIFVLGLVSPGPDFMIVSSISLSRGRAHGLQAALGIATGVLIYYTLGLLGVAAVFKQALWLAVTIKILGGAYLIYLGAMAWRSTFKKSESQSAKTVKVRNPYISGLLTNLTNPKAIAFATSIYALALSGDPSAETKLALVAMTGVTAFAWFAFVVTGLSHAAVRARYQKAHKLIDRVAGSVMILFGIKLVSSAAD